MANFCVWGKSRFFERGHVTYYEDDTMAEDFLRLQNNLLLRIIDGDEMRRVGMSF